MQITQRSLYFFAVLHVLTFSTILCEINVKREKRELSEDDLAVRKLLHSSEGFLAGEDTPVWIAYRPDSDKPVSYTKLEKGIVKRAIDYWKSDEFKGLANRARRSVDKYTETVKNFWASSTEMFLKSSTPEFSEKSPKPRETRATGNQMQNLDPTVYHPSLMIMMDYQTDWPTDERSEQKLIMERILYALAFWNGIDSQLRHIKNPYVRLRIAGIIIGRNKAATPYLRENENWLGLGVSAAFVPMMKYWRKMANVNADFPMGAYDIVVTMTDESPSPGFIRTTYGIASPGPPCVKPGVNIAGLLFPDDLAFGGIQAAVHEISHILGGTKHDGDTDECPRETGNVMAPSVGSIGRKWSACSLRYISTTLKYQGWCMRNAKEFHPPGKPVEAILPGKLMWASKQCQARGWADGYVCWEYVTCDYLYCANDRWDSPCKNSGPAIDGTTCNPGKMCLDGKCVSNTTITVT